MNTESYLLTISSGALRNISFSFLKKIIKNIQMCSQSKLSLSLY